MPKKIILIITIVGIFIGGIFIGGAGVYMWGKKYQPPIEPEQTKQSECEKLTYFNETYGYSLKIPREWAGKYEIREEGSTVSFFYIPVGNKLEYDIFWVSVYSKDEWEKELKERKEAEKKGLAPGCCPKVFAKINGTVFEYNDFLGESPYDDPEINPQIVKEFQKMKDQVQEIIASFSLSK